MLGIGMELKIVSVHLYKTTYKMLYSASHSISRRTPENWKKGKRGSLKEWFTNLYKGVGNQVFVRGERGLGKGQRWFMSDCSTSKCNGAPFLSWGQCLQGPENSYGPPISSMASVNSPDLLSAVTSCFENQSPQDSVGG